MEVLHVPCNNLSHPSENAGLHLLISHFSLKFHYLFPVCFYCALLYFIDKASLPSQTAGRQLQRNKVTPSFLTQLPSWLL